jgi:putative flavoprotein involved in K+ transport
VFRLHAGFKTNLREGEAILAQEQVSGWLAALERAVADPADTDWDALFAGESYWRDFVALTWNIATFEGAAAIGAMLTAQASLVRPRGFAASDEPLALPENQCWFTFETDTARCRGIVQLDDGRATMVLSSALELKGYEEPTGPRRDAGVSHRAERGRETWIDRRERAARELGRGEQPYCLIVGGGQNGLALAARLKRLAVPTLVVDSLPRPGDSWRARYRSLHLHDPAYLDEFPYLPFPDHWPLYTHKDKMGDWLEIYAKAMELDFWGGTQVAAAQYDAERGEWRVEARRDGEELALRPRQLVLATGLSGAKHLPEIPGAESFAGLQCHSADHVRAEDVAGKAAVVIGSNNSAHDIAADLWEAGARVTMIQRSPTIVVRADTMKTFSDALPYADPAVPRDLADLAGAAPFRLQEHGHRAMTDSVKAIDAPFYARLEQAGFLLSHGEDGTGFLSAYARRAAGYYIDVGASDLIADGEIALAVGEVAGICEDGVEMVSGAFLPAELIVHATGYRPLHEWVGRLISPEMERKVGPCWGLGSGTRGDPGPWEGELRNMWKPTAQPGLWFQGGNLMQARFHSLHLALQLKARMEGLPTPVYAGPKG